MKGRLHAELLDLLKMLLVYLRADVGARAAVGAPAALGGGVSSSWLASLSGLLFATEPGGAEPTPLSLLGHFCESNSLVPNIII